MGIGGEVWGWREVGRQKGRQRAGGRGQKGRGLLKVQEGCLRFRR